jgi:hypothetical protein
MQLGQYLTGIEWHGDRAWTINRFSDTVPEWPFGTIHGSWKKEDSNTGTIASTAFPAPPGTA